MKILIVHNLYKNAGGEDVVVENEMALLKSKGHEVRLIQFDNKELDQIGKFTGMVQSIWNSTAAHRIDRVCLDFQPKIVHFHNIFYRCSPAPFWKAAKHGLKIVLTLHNYRMICPSATFFRSGLTCTLCLGKAFAYPAVRHKCFQKSAFKTSILSASNALHNFAGTFSKVNTFICLTEFSRFKFIQSGLPQTKITVKPNFLPFDPGIGKHDGSFCLFVGRLSKEKGIESLIAAWKIIGSRVPLHIVGTGPLKELVETPVDGVKYIGFLSRQEILRKMQQATLLVFPSLWYEGFPMVFVEAFATALPVLAHNLGSSGEIIKECNAGWLTTSTSPTALAAKTLNVWDSKDALAEAGKRARKAFLERYSAETNYKQLLNIYSNS